jgi:hypothetical protein
MFKFLRKTALWIVAVPLLFIYLGAAANQAVLVANHDRFPVMWNSYKAVHYELAIEHAIEKDPEDVQAHFDLVALRTEGYLDDTHVLMTTNTHLNFLADWIDLKDATYSIGDVLLLLGEKASEYSFPIWCAVVIGRLRKHEE